MSLVLERVVFVVVELLMDLASLNWFFFSVVAFVVESMVFLMDLIGLVWFLISKEVFLLDISSLCVASSLLPRKSSFWAWASKKVNKKREAYRKNTNKKERGLLLSLKLRREEEAISRIGFGLLWKIEHEN